MTNNPQMPRKDRLRRVVILCCSFARNLAYYRVAWSEEHRHLLQPGNAHLNFWLQVNGNFLEMCVLEWCKLFADKKGKHFWEKIVSDASTFEESLLRHLRLEMDEFEKKIKTMKFYRDKHIAHLDSERWMYAPKLDIPKKAVWFYHVHIVNHEAQPGDLEGLPQDLEKGYEETEQEAIAIYQRNS